MYRNKSKKTEGRGVDINPDSLEKEFKALVIIEVFTVPGGPRSLKKIVQVSDLGV